MTGNWSEVPQTKVTIPSKLTKFAAEVGLNMHNTLNLLDMHKQIIAHSCAKKKGRANSFDLQKFYEKLKDFPETERSDPRTH